MKIQRISVFLLWLAAIITLGHSVVPHHHHHDDVTEISNHVDDDHESDLGNVFHHVHGLTTGPETSYLPHQSHQLNFSKSLTETPVLVFLISTVYINNPGRIVISDYGEPPPDFISQFLVSVTSFRGPPAFRA